MGLVGHFLARRAQRRASVQRLLREHFGPIALDQLTITERKFPFRVRADLQRCVDRLFAEDTTVARFCGIRKEMAHEGLTFPGIIVDSYAPAVVAPPEYEEVDVGDEQPVRCLKNGLWLLKKADERFAVLLAPACQYDQTTGMTFQIATVTSGAGAATSEAFFNRLEQSVLKAESYRGKVLSLEVSESYTGQSTGIKVHKLRTVGRDQVILPRKTLDLLDRNIIGFVSNRPKLTKFQQATKKGILFYGPPGTGKTHTLHYLAGSLPQHTTLLISAEQVALLGEYMTLARLLQPSLLVIEDVDLIARDRTTMQSPCEEVLLNKLLNEMDGLREDADILFILTTNRPEMLEAALASRPGRVDQAIEFPLPDDEGRRKLVALYSHGAIASEDVLAEVVKRTEGVSPAFIKELMRRSVQFHLERSESLTVELRDVESALEEMLFSGGSLNCKLLGGRWDGEDGRAVSPVHTCSTQTIATQTVIADGSV